MTDQAEESTDSGERKLYPWVIAGVIVLLMVAFLTYRVALIVLLNNEKEALRKKGYAVTLEELAQSYPPVPSEENAALVYQKALKAYKRPSKDAEDILPFVGNAEAPPVDAPLSDEALAAAREHLADNEYTLELLHEAAGMERCRYPVDFTQGAAMAMPHIHELRKATQLLALQALVQAVDGRSTGAVRSTVDIMRAAESLKNEPTLISQLGRIALEDYALESFRRTASLTRMSDDDLRRLSEALQRAENGVDRSMKRSFLSNLTIVMTLDAENLLLYGGPSFRSTTPGRLVGPSRISSVVLGFYRLSGLDDMDRLAVVGYYDKVAGIFQTPPWKQLGAARKVEDKLSYSSSSRIGSWFHVIRTAALPALFRGVLAHIQSRAKLRAARTATAVQRFRLDHGRLPGSLSELTPRYLDKVPKDPFLGKPLRYATTPAGYVTYSVGEDRVDDGGIRKKHTARRDVSFSVKLPVEERSAEE